MEPIELHVRLTPSDEVLKLRQDVSELKAKLQALQGRYDRLEYDRRIEYIYNGQLCDLLREHGISFLRTQDLRQMDKFGDLR